MSQSKSARRLPALAAVFLLCSAHAHAADFYVSPQGGDANPGTVARPFATLEAARDAVRALKQRGPWPKAGVTVYLSAGTYPLQASFQLEAGDSGTAAAPVVYKTQPNEAVTLTGARTLPKTVFKPVTDATILNRVISADVRPRLLQIDLKANGITDFGRLSRHGFSLGSDVPPLEFYLNGRRQERARWPNTGSVRMGKIQDKGPVEGEADFNTRGGTFQVDFDRIKYWSQAKDLWLEGVFGWDWAWSYNKVARVDAEQRTLTLERGEIYGLMAANKDFFTAQNLLEEIDEPGEYYLDRESGLLYWLPPAEFAAPDSTVSVSLLRDPMVRLNGASFITFEGLNFEGGRDLALRCEGGEGVKITHCRLRNFGRGAISLTGSHHRIQNCDISDVGDTAININGGDRTTLTAGDNAVDNCRITHWGYWQKVYNPGVSLRGVGNRITHCVFADAPHCAVLVSGNDHLIENNEFHHVLRDFKDMGVIYLNLGMAPLDRGTVIRHNYLHDIGAEQDKLVGVYPDNGTMGLLVEGNIFYKFGTPQHQSVRAISGNGFSYVTARNNVFIDCVQPYDLSFFLNSWAKKDVPNYEKKWRTVLAATDLANGPYGQRYPELRRFFEEDRVLPDSNVFERNLIYNPTVKRAFPGAYITRDGASEKVQARDNWVAAADPGFLNLNAANFAFRPDAEAFKQIPGFAAIPVADIGLNGPVGPIQNPAPAETALPKFTPGAGQLGWFAEKVRRHETVRIGAIGGSITQGAGASSVQNSYFWTFASNFGKELKQRGATPQFSWAAAGGTNSAYGAYRAGIQLLNKDLDLLIVEFAVNDDGNPEALDGMEGIVRQALRRNPRTAILFFYTTTANYQRNFYSQNLLPPAVETHARVANFYSIAALNAGPLVNRALQAGQFTPETFWKDGVHPLDAGHAFYAKLLTGALTSALDQPVPELRPLPAPLAGGVLERARLELVVPEGPREGWNLSNEDWYGVKSWKCTTAGQPMTFNATGSRVGIFYRGNLKLRWTAPGQPEKTAELREPVRRPSPGNYLISPSELPPGTKITAEAIPGADGTVAAEIFGVASVAPE